MSTRDRETLSSQLSERAGFVESPYEAAAHLESLGVTDRDAAEQYGEGDVFDLALDLAREQREETRSQATAAEAEARRSEAEYEKVKPQALSTAIPRFFLRGVAFGLPMVIMVFAILILFYSLWAYYYFSISTGTAIGVGTALSYLLAGGFTQAIGRRGLMYLRQGQYLLCLKVSALLVAVGAALTVIVGVVLWTFFGVFPVISSVDRNLAVVYFFTLSLLWLTLGVVYMLQSEIVFSIAIALGIGVVYVLREQFAWDIVPAHQIGILSAALFSAVYASVNLYLRHRQAQEPNIPSRSKLPRFSMLASTLAPYFVFGFLFFMLLFGDRIIAWTGRAAFKPTFISFKTDYEVGLNWALIGLLPAFGALEFTVYRFIGFVEPQMLSYPLAQASRFRAWFFRFFSGQVAVYWVMAFIGGVIAWFGMHALVDRIPEIRILLNDISKIVFVIAAAGYAFAAFGLLNTSILFALGRPRMPLLAILPALAIDFVVGFVLSRMVIYWLAAVGLLLGGVTFGVLSLIFTLRVIRRLDYYSYASF